MESGSIIYMYIIYNILKLVSSIFIFKLCRFQIKAFDDYVTLHTLRLSMLLAYIVTLNQNYYYTMRPPYMDVVIVS